MSLHVIHGWRDLSPEQKGAALAIGNFDGVHRGHRKVIADAARAAAALHAPLGVVTFEPHPRRWFNPAAQPFRLTTLDPSSAVRQALRDGDMRRAASLLGRPYAIEGVVVHGDQLGRTIGFPTANISLEDYVRPAFGIYACRTRLADGREVASVGYVGRRPTVVDGVDERLEVHLFDFDEDLYGQTLDVQLTDLVRGDRKFDSLEAMVAQMEHDAARARELLMPAF